jgi:hypothetical protein
MDIENYFKLLNSIKCEKSDKNWLSYISWSDAWAEVKKIYPDSRYTIYENENWFPFWESKFGIDVKVWVIINNIEHIVRLPVLDWANKPQKSEDYKYIWVKWVQWKKTEVEKICKAANQFDINKAIQRAFAKAIAMHGVWLYVFRWEDLPEDIVEDIKKEIFTKRQFKEIVSAYNEWWPDLAKHTFDDLSQDYDSSWVIEKIVQLSKCYKENQHINDEQMNKIWKPLPDTL